LNEEIGLIGQLYISGIFLETRRDGLRLYHTEVFGPYNKEVLNATEQEKAAAAEEEVAISDATKIHSVRLTTTATNAVVGRDRCSEHARVGGFLFPLVAFSWMHQ
jgi:hypothetical protein